MNGTLRLILGDQLNESISSLEGCDKMHDTILMVEVMEEATYVVHHKQKIAFLFSAMRHFAGTLAKKGHRVRYIRLDAAGNTGSFDGEVVRELKRENYSAVVVTEPGEWRLLQKFLGWGEILKVPVEIRRDTRFLCSIPMFKRWAEGKLQLRMEYFYRGMRREHGILLTADGKPEGGKWNYDTLNRKPPKKGLHLPARIRHKRDPITREVLVLAEQRFAGHFGTLEHFNFAVTRDQALQELQHFIRYILPDFGTYQDAMLTDQPFLNHSVLSPYINAGLLLPLEVCKAAEDAYRKGDVPLHSCEGFIRQILGWREFIRGIYWLKMPEYAERNYLDVARPVPDFYWTGETDMFCMAQAIDHTRDFAYSHHIQRLMVTGNFALLAGLDVKEVCEWYLLVYADAYEWVELPNTLGMALFADSGIAGSKPYAASGKYIHRMSDYCGHCRYDPGKAIGEDACPFNALYWNFLDRNEKKMRGNPRMALPYKNLDAMDESQLDAIRTQAENFLAGLKPYRA